MNSRKYLVGIVALTLLMVSCSGRNDAASDTNPQTKNASLDAPAPSITRVESGDGSLTVHVELPADISPNTWFYQLSTDTPGALNPILGGTATVRNAPESFTIGGLTNGATYTVRVAHWNGNTSDYASATAVVGTTDQATTTQVTATTQATTTTQPVATSTTNAVTTTTVLACRLGGDCAIGDTGPGGGIVFYDAGSIMPWGRYLEVAPQNLTAAEFGCIGSKPSSSLASIGDGRKNSEDINYSLCGANTPAKAAFTFTLAGATGWYLPSKDELNELCKFARGQRTGSSGVACAATGTLRPGFSPTFYWSSTETDDNFAWYQNFVTGLQLSYGKPTSAAVRPIRAFTNKDGVTVATTAAPPPCSRGGTCAVGDTGPGGGTVFYVAPSMQPWGQYMEITKQALAVGGWGCSRTTNLSTSRAFGEGPANTRSLVAAGCDAARTADNYVSPTGLDDWFLPSDDELRTAAQARAFSGVSSAWTSSTGSSCGYGYCFTRSRTPSGADGDEARTTSNATLAVRMFRKVG